MTRLATLGLLACCASFGLACGGTVSDRGADAAAGGGSGGSGTAGASGTAGTAGSMSDAGWIDGGAGSPIIPVVARCPIEGVTDTEVIAALDTGDGSGVSTAEQLLDATHAAITGARTRMDPALIALFGLASNGSAGPASLTAVDWDPRHDAATFRTTPGQNAPALLTASSSEAEALAVVGESVTARYLVLGANPFRTNPDRDNSNVVNAQMNQWLANAVGWLTRTESSATKNVVLAQLDESHWFADDSATRAWLTTTFGAQVTMNASGACDGAALDGCVSAKPNLLIVSQFYDELTHDPDGIADAVARALAEGVAVLYLQHDGSMNALGDKLLRLLHVAHIRDNYRSGLSVAGFDGATTLGLMPEPYAQIDSALSHLRSGSFDFSLADVAAGPGEHAMYQAQFGAGVTAVRDLLRGHDEAGTDLFADCTHAIDRLLVLTGDRLRQDIRYPMSHVNTDATAFLRAYFADHAVSNLRSVGPAQPDRGNFDPKDLSGVEGVTKTVTITSRRWFRSTGAYLLPGKPARITRLDAADVHTKIFVNSIRNGATHEWDASDDAYPRPKFLQSAHIPLAPGQSIVMVSPYGGPLQVELDVSGVDIELRFEDVGEHPHWRSSDDDARFTERLAAGTYNWVEVATAGFELHSRADNFAGTMEDERWNTPAKLAETIEKYTFDEVHIMAGFAGDGITERDEVHGWAASKGLTVPTLDLVKHANMDQATCGSGCSGNPYDAYWSFSPIGHGDLHELGHSLQNSRFQIRHNGADYGNHAVTNWSPFHTASRYYEDHGGSVPGWEIPHAHLFAQLQAAYVAGERAGDVSAAMNRYLGDAIVNNDEIRNCYAFFMQAGMSARHAGVLNNGYYIVPRVHIVARAFSEAQSDESTWAAARAGIGFDQLSLADAESITNNDFMLIALSFVTELDYRDYFAMWGVEVSATASAQVASFGFSVVPRAFYAMSSVDHSLGALSTEHARIPRLVIDGIAAWPTP